MDGQDVTRRLDALEYLDQETTAAYETAIDKLATEEVSRELDAFRRDHDEHVRHFAELTDELEWTRGGASQQYRRFAEEHRRLLQSAPDGEHALEALLALEQENLAELRRAEASEELPPEAAEVVGKHILDEERHVGYILRHAKQVTGASQVEHGSTRYEGGPHTVE